VNILPQAYNGNGMVVSQLPFVETNTYMSQPFNEAIVISSGTDARFFDGIASTGTTGAPHFFIKDQLVHTTNSTFVLTDSSGNRFTFNDFNTSITTAFGAFQSMTDPGGNVTSVVSRDNYDPPNGHYGRPLIVQRTTPAGQTPAITESYIYSYIANPDTSVRQGGVISHVTLQRQVAVQSPVVLRQVAYSYYVAGEAHGNPGDLKLAQIEDGAGNVIDTKYYRATTRTNRAATRVE